MKTHLVIIEFIVLAITKVCTIQITEFKVPTFVKIGDPVEMRCEFNLSKGEVIYTIKWYKEEIEFFRYEPGQKPKTKYFPVPGVNLDKTKSNYSNVRLKEVNNYTSGTFVCEVSVDGSFVTVESEKKMFVKSSSHGWSLNCRLFLITIMLLHIFF